MPLDPLVLPAGLDGKASAYDEAPVVCPDPEAGTAVQGADLMLAAGLNREGPDPLRLWASVGTDTDHWLM